jgi:hypothetical protein
VSGPLFRVVQGAVWGLVPDGPLALLMAVTPDGGHLTLVVEGAWFRLLWGGQRAFGPQAIGGVSCPDESRLPIEITGWPAEWPDPANVAGQLDAWAADLARGWTFAEVRASIADAIRRQPGQ